MNRNYQYNTEREKLGMSEYGRAVHDMVRYALGIEDRAERQACAETIVQIMAQLQGERLANAETAQKLWNHLAVISNFELDIDYPVEIIDKTDVEASPEKVNVPTHNIRRKHYGHLLEQSLAYASTLPEGEERKALTRDLANRMKQSLFTWNPDVMSEDKVRTDLDEYSQGVLGQELDGFKFAGVQSISTSIKKKKR